jgi:phosphoribosylanthranilate isomerase
MRVRVKICGITRLSDARVAVEAGADALGFMFYAPSPRHVTIAQARDLIRQLPPFIERVGVFVNPTEAEVREAVEGAGLSAIQLHGEEPPEFCAQFAPLPVIKAWRVKDATSLEGLAAYRDVAAWLLDAYVKGQRGGTGERFNWALAERAKAHGVPIILAGGLTPENAAAAVRQVRPYGLDVSSGVEAAPGRKDPARLRAFLAAARAA